MPRVASLPMYDLAEVRGATDGLWQLIAAALRDAGVPSVPDALSRDEPYPEFWLRDDLVLSQTCGYPLVNDFKDRLRPVATPRYAVPGCRGVEYSSVVLVRAASDHEAMDSLRGGVCAVNSPASQSGYNALRVMFAPLAGDGHFFSEVMVTGSHLASVEALTSGRADVCAVDCVTYALFGRYRPSELEGTRVLTYTPSCPGLPFVTPKNLDEIEFRNIRAAMREAFSDPAGAKARAALFIEDVAEVELGDYAVALEMEARAVAFGYMAIK
jgi:ABC-type phosphate/phosphonate transport system substrate-binding protein